MESSQKQSYIYLASVIFLFIVELSTADADNETSSTVATNETLNRTLNSVQKVDLNSVPTIGLSNYSVTMNKTIPILESFVLNNKTYNSEKANAENVTLPLNVRQVIPPSKLDNNTVRNFFISQNNISRNAGITTNDSCIQYSEDKPGQKQSLNICNPPDVQIAPGKEQVIEMTNNFIAVWNKSDLISNKTILNESSANSPIYWTNNFFNVNQKNDTFDPSIIYDPLSHRWFSTLVEFEVPDNDQLRKSDKMGVLLSYSDSDDYKRWTVMKFSPRLIFPSKTTYFCPDRPMIYASTDKVLISMTVSDPENKLCDANNDSTRWLFMAVFNKTQLLDDDYKRKDFDVIKVYDRNYHYVPVKSNLNKSEIDLVNIAPFVDEYLMMSYIKINGTLDNLHHYVYDRNLGYEKHLPPNAVQKGTNTRLYLADNRIIDAFETDNNETWITFHNDCKIMTNNTSCIRLVKFTIDKGFGDLTTTNNSTNATGFSFKAGNMTASSIPNSAEIHKMASKGTLPLEVANSVVSKLFATSKNTGRVLDKVTAEIHKTMPSVNKSEIVKLGGNASLLPPIANNVISNMMIDPKVAPIVINEIRDELRSDKIFSRVLDFQIGFENYYYYYPTIAMSKNGSLVVYFAFSSKNNYPSLGLAVLNTSLLSQSGNTVKGPLIYDSILVRNGTSFAQEESIINDYCPASNPCTRYGDYFSIVKDPFNSSQLWAAGEYYDDKYFSTLISNIRLR